MLVDADFVSALQNRRRCGLLRSIDHSEQFSPSHDRTSGASIPAIAGDHQ